MNPWQEKVVTALLTELSAILRKMLADNAFEITASTRFEDLADWDAMDLVAVVVEVECRYGLQFELHEIDRLITVDDFMHMIVAKQALISA
jgi:acyl carrier protein